MFQIKDLKPGKAKALTAQFAEAFARRGVDPEEIWRHPENFQGELTTLHGKPAICFTYAHGTMYCGDIIPIKDLKKGRKMKGA